MTSNAYNERDLGFLLSRSLDDDLTVEERRQLEVKLRESAELQAEAAQMRKVNEFVRRWSQTEAKVDWETHASLVSATVEPQEKTDSHLDGVLSRWAAQSPAVDDDRFVEGVLGRISSRRRLPAYARILRYGVPLAAAAVLGLMVTAVFWNAPPVSRPIGARSLVRIERPDSGFAITSFVRSEVSFARTGDIEPAADEGIALLSLGASTSRGWTEASPL